MLGLLGAPALAVTGTTATLETTGSEDMSVTVTPTASASLHPGEDLALTVTIENGTTAAVGPGTIDVSLAERALTSRAALQNWLRPDQDGNSGDLLLGTPTTEPIEAGATMTLPITVPAANVGLGVRNAWGARGVAARFTVDGATVEGRGTFVWDLGDTVTPVALAAVTRITTPETSSGLLPADELQAFTEPTGLLTTQLDAVVDRPVAIAIDPRIIVSIRLLGNAAPPGAIAWLDRLSAATNDIFPLRYANSDASLEAQSGAETLLEPLSFDALLDPANFAAVPETTSPTTPVTPEQIPGSVPTSAELLAWDYTVTDLVWPGENGVARADLATFTANGLTTTILSSGNTRQSDSFTPNSVFAHEDGRALVADQALSDAINAAAQAPTDAAWRAAVAEAQSLLAIVSAEDIRSPRTLLATLDHDTPASDSRLGATLDALAGVPWETPATLANALSAPVADTVEFRGQAESVDRVNLVRQLRAAENDVTAFAESVAEPLTVTAPHRLNLLALHSPGWTRQPDLWAEHVQASLAKSAGILQSVAVTTRGPINVAADKVDFPITLRNDLDQAVTVRVQVVPSNGRLLVESDIDATIDANSASTITVPVTAAVGNGEVALRVTMYSPAGVAIGEPAVIAVNVHADWEGIGAWLVASLAFLFFGFGIWRNIVRRRKERKGDPVHADTDRAEQTPVETPTDRGDE